MDIEILEKLDNPLLKRVELRFVLHHVGEKTPDREAVRERIAKELNGKKENVIVDTLESEYGRGATKGFAKLYESADAAKAVEREHLLIRNGLVQPKED